MPTVDVFSWNPVRRRYSSRIGRRLPLHRPVNNFGDLLGPLVVDAMLARHDLEGVPARDAQLFTVGSVLHFAPPGAVVWGSGINGKIDAATQRFASLDVRAVRGPKTLNFLRAQNIAVPEVFGDPALLLGELAPELAEAHVTRELTVVPNLNDLRDYRGVRQVLDPRTNLHRCLSVLTSSRLVVGSSLHAIVVAEAYGVPARLVRSNAEAAFKYADYYLATGRPGWQAADSVVEAREMGGEPPPKWSPEPLLSAFPLDLWAA